MKGMDEINIITDFLQGLNQNNAILYVGRGVKSTELSQAVCNLNWRCIITSQTKSDFGKEFVTEQRTPKRYTRLEELPSNIFDRINLPIVQIYGVDGSVEENIDDVDNPFMTNLLRKKNAEKIMSQIMGRLDVRCKMVVIGYDLDNSFEFPVDSFMPLWYEMQGGTLLFFGQKDIPDKRYGQDSFCTMIEKCGFVWCETTLQELLEKERKIVEDDSECEIQPIEGKNLFYKGKEPVVIATSLLLRCRNFAQLLTEESVYQRRPLGRTQQALWYFNFLNESTITPQWYGYLPQSDFYLKRFFEDTLVDLVRNIISSKNMYIPGKATPVILEGDPGSSKSITLAALAYRVFNEKINPVVYIKNDSILFNSANSQELEQLDELLREIELAGSKDMRTLILWDSASYRNVSELANSLAHQLSNKGRRFVLVCTAYKGAGIGRKEEVNDKENGRREFIRWYSHSNDATFRLANERKDNKEVFFDGRNYFIQSSRYMNENEKRQLQLKISQYSNIESNVLKRIWSRLEVEAENDIFTYFYRLVGMIRPNLEMRLSNEQRIISTYVNKQLRILEDREREEDNSGNIMLNALLKAGIQLKQEDISALEEGETEEEQVYYDLDKFNICIAMFSRFKLDAPYTLGIHMLYSKEAHKQKSFYNNIDLFNLVTCDIPWIYYGEDVRGNFVFRFRNSLEAEIFLEKNAITAEQQVNIICDMLDCYASTYGNLGYEDEILARAIQKIMRMVGPNTDYPPFCSEGMRSQQHQMLLEKLDVIINKLTHLREKLRVPDADASFANIEITFLREYYGKLWDKLHHRYSEGSMSKQPWEEEPELYTPEEYGLRVKMLKKASELALTNIDKLEQIGRGEENTAQRRHILDQINSLSVEISYCNTSLEELWDCYQKACCFVGKKQDINLEDIRPLTYLHQYQMLLKAITVAPTNGYAYNALFNLFEKEYQRSNEERRLQLLSEVRMIADDATTLEITNRGMNGRDTLSEYIQKIMQYSGGFKVDIESVLQGSCSSAFNTLFASMLEKNNASGITFVCQQELDTVGLDGKTLSVQQETSGGEYVLTEQQVDTCHRILEFMRRDEYVPCVNKDPYALYLMLRIAWMYYNKRPMGDSIEAQLTYIENQGWEEIRQICENYQECSGFNKRPIVTLLHALALVQLGNDYIQANRMLESLNEDVFSSTARMRVPYIICKEPGVPKIYSGTVLSTKNYGGFIRVNDIPQQLGSKTGVRFAMKNLGMQSMPQKRQVINEIELGLGYTGFSVYTKEGRKNKEGKDE
ncbi:MAG: hypothetical protein HDR21_08435 [Lachnospiraceae bacterium]|nr:hypothetical protein [Lachnospiraceae bacterium]